MTPPQRGQAKGANSLSGLAESSILNAITKSIASTARNATFAIGGSVPIQTGDDTIRRDGEDPIRASDPVQIRFDSRLKGMHHVTLPSSDTLDGLQELISACSPASFGRGNKDVYDETYRKASKLDTDAFLTSFCPYQTGIIDLIQQMLLPISSNQRDFRGIRAELYKLNVYSAPSGLFKAHVDTPRSESQFGSLVVSLPVKHEGGQLVVRHSGEELVFDWSTPQEQDPHPSVKWAAFYSDCEHEVLEVTSGHRITLTYNLYTTARASGYLASGGTNVLDATQLPLYDNLSTALANPSFLAGGRVLAVYLTHSYAHTSATHNFLPSSLKGADMVLYETARALGLACYIRPIATFNDVYNSKTGTESDVVVMGSRPLQFVIGCDSPLEDDEEIVETMRDVMGAGEKWTESAATWLNGEAEGKKEPQMAYITYGNETSVDLSYSAAVMLIRVPPFHNRGNERVSEKVFHGLRIKGDTDSEGTDSESTEQESSEDGEMDTVEHK